MRSKNADAERERLVAIYAGWLEEEIKVERKNSPVHQEFSLREFVSRRAFGKKRKKPKEVRLLGVNGLGFTDLLAKNPQRRMRLDSYAEAALQRMGIEPDTRAVEKIIEILRERK